MDSSIRTLSPGLQSILHVRFSGFTLDSAQRRLERDGVPVELTPKQFDALLLLVGHAGDLVGKEQFYATLWPNTVVSETSLNKYIWQLRRILGENNDGTIFIETVPKRGYRFIAAVEPIASDVVETAVIVDLAVMDPIAPIQRSDTKSRRHTKQWIAAAVGCAIVATAAYVFWQQSISAPASPSGTRAPVGNITHRRAIALMQAQIDSDLPEWLRSAVPQLLAKDLAVSEQLRISYPNAWTLRYPDLIAQAQAAEPQPTQFTDWPSLDADVVVVPSVVRNSHGDAASDVTLRLKLLDARTGAALEETQSRGSLQQIDRLVASAGDRARAALGVTPMSDAIARVHSASMPHDAQAAQLYAEGIELQMQGKRDAARDKLRELTERNPEFVPGWLELATEELDASLGEKAAATAQTGLTHAVAATRELRLSLEAVSYAGSGAWTQAIDTYRSLYRFFPDQPEYALRLISAQIYGGHKDDAEETLRLLRETPGMSDDVFVLQAEYTLAQKSNDDARARDVATHLLARASTLRLPHLHARALASRGMALTGLRDNDAALTDLQQAEHEFLPLGDTEWNGKVQLLLGNWSMRRGDLVEAEARFHRAVDDFRAIGARWNENVSLGNLMAIAVARGDPAAARPYVDDVLQSTRKLGDTDGESRALIFLAWVELDSGRTDAATEAYQRAVSIDEKSKQPEQLIMALSSLADVLADTGQIAAARNAAERARGISESISSISYKSMAAAAVGRIERAAKNTVPARVALDTARQLAQQGQDADRAARIDLHLAQLDLDEHHAQAALDRLVDAEAVLTKSESTADLTSAAAIRARAWCELGKIDEAKAAFALSQQQSAKTTGYLDRLPSRFAEIQVSACSGDRDKARRLAVPLREELRARKFSTLLAELDKTLAAASRLH